MFSKMVDDLVNKLKNASYKSSGSYTSDLTVLSGYNKDEIAAARQAIAEWLQDNHNDLAVENEALKQKLFICNEIISKSNFAPMIVPTVREEMTKRKANTPIKRKQMIARTALKNLCIATVLGEAERYTVMNYKSRNEVKVSQQVAELIAGLPWKWYFECSVVCRDQNGKEYIVSETVHCESAYRQSDPRLNKFLNTHHKAFLAKQNNLHVITLAWVAVPAIGDKVDLEIETLDKIYTKLGAFEYLSTWENNQLEEAA